MRESEIRIRQYKARLPRIRERVIATLMLFAFSIVMMTMTAFAWTTLSIKPEVSGVTTAIAANGSLEVALASGNGSVPGDSQVGDSNLPLTERNLTWGNLVNLSDISYGMDNIILRPAKLNTEDLLSSPLASVKYWADGRIEKENYDFGYAKWNTLLGNFEESDEKGVRAVADIKYTEVEYEDPMTAYYNEKINGNGGIIETYNAAGREFHELANHMDAVGGLLAAFMNSKLSGTGSAQACAREDVEALYDLMLMLDQKAMTSLGNALMMTFEIYQRNTSAGNNNYTYTPYTSLDEFCTNVKTDIGKMNQYRTWNGATLITYDAKFVKTSADLTGTITSLGQYISDRAKLKSLISEMAAVLAGSSQTIAWGDIQSIVNAFVEINSCTINGIKVTELMNNKSAAADMVFNDYAKNNAVIHAGLLYRVDAMVRNGGQQIKVPKIGVTIDASSIVPLLGNITVKANVKTSAPDSYPQATVSADISKMQDIINVKLSKGAAVAQDTYGLVVDFWLRTNANNAYLTLEGETQTDSVAVTKTINNVAYPVYTANVKTIEYIFENGVPVYTDDTKTTQKTAESFQEHDVYQMNGIWYYYKNDAAVVSAIMVDIKETDENGLEVTKPYKASETLIDGTPAEKTTTVVIGYSGVNRIWDDDELPTDVNLNYLTSQGSGSCYTFYAATPTDREQSLAVLSEMKVIFVSSEGELMARAYLDTDNYFAEYGKVVVPLVLEADYTVGTTNDGKDIRAITQMVRNEPLFVTAIVYLEGENLENSDVLASSAIDGQLNLQFGTTNMPMVIDNENLMRQELRITAAAAVTEFIGVGETTITLDVQATDEDAQPNTITANFIRVISNSQGTLQAPIHFTRTGTDTWTATASFNAPGTYILRSVYADGIERTLVNEETETLTITVAGFQCSDVVGLTHSENYYLHRTSSNSVTEEFQVNVTTDASMSPPTSVKGVFMSKGLDENITVTVNFQPNADRTIWKGSATFAQSATYELLYVMINNKDYYEVSPITREVYVGLSARVYLEPQDTYRTDEPSEQFTVLANGYRYNDVGMGLTHTYSVNVVIYDNNGNRMEGLRGVELYYTGGLDANLYWDATSRSYTGTHFLIDGPGNYKFRQIMIGGEIITSAVAPSIIVIPSDPAEYVGTEVVGVDENNQSMISGVKETTQSGTTQNTVIKYRVIGDNKASLEFKFKNASAATLIATFDHDGATVKQEVQATSTVKESDASGKTYDVSTFAVDLTDGVWTLTNVELYDVYDGNVFYDGTADEEGEIAYFTPTVDEVETITVISTLYVTFDKAIKNFGSTSTPAFEPYNIAAGTLNVTITDYAGNDASQYVEGVSLAFAKPGSDVTKYGYANPLDAFEIALHKAEVATVSDNGVMNIFTNDAYTFMFAGNYQYNLHIQFRENTTSYATLNDLMFTLDTMKPSVRVMGVTPGAGSTFRLYTDPIANDGSVKYDNMIRPDVFRYDDHSATVYIYAPDQEGRLDNEYLRPKAPEVTLQLSGITTNANFTGAKMTFANASNVSYAKTFSFTTANMTSTSAIGACSNGSSSSDLPKIFPAGKQVVDTIEVTYAGKTYTVGITTPITINQPQYPPYLSFVISGNGFNGTVPSTIYAENGDSFQVKLPTISTWNSTDVSTKDVGRDNPTYTNNANADVCTYNSGGCGGKGSYTYYTRKSRYYLYEKTTTTTVNTYGVIGWTIDGKTYSPGETVTVSSNQTAVAVIGVISAGQPTSVTETWKVTETYDVKVSEENGNAKGEKVSSVYTSGWTVTSDEKQ